MKSRSSKNTLIVLAMASLLSAGAAQAGMGSCLSSRMGSSGGGCASEQGSGQACQLRDERGNRGNRDNLARQGDSCGVDRQEMMQAVGTVAAGGIGIATQVMRTLLDEANRYVGTSQDF